MIFDVRFLPNPHWVPELRPQTGLSAPVSAYVLGQPGATPFLASLRGGPADRRGGLPAGGQAVRHDRRSGARAASTAARRSPRSSPAGSAPTGCRPPSCTGTSGANEAAPARRGPDPPAGPPRGRRAAGGRGVRRRARPVRLALGPAPRDRPAHGGRDGRRRRRLVRPPPRTSSAASRPATCGWPWPRSAATTSPGVRGPTSCSTGSSRPARSATTRSATCSSPGSGNASATRSPGWTWWPGCSAAPAGCCRWRPCRWRSRPRSSASRPTARRDLVRARAGPRRQDHRRGRARCTSSRRTRPPAPSPSRPCWTPTGWCSGPARGSPR